MLISFFFNKCNFYVESCDSLTEIISRKGPRFLKIILSSVKQ